jgi:diadenosine tetraphosphatase ApaH/serine/threonine PP2A family protein phosphatase
MRYAILSDVHGRRHKLEVVIADVAARGVDRIVSLGDVGGDECLSLLERVGALAVFGNYEVSGWKRLQPRHQAWVRSWPLLLVEDGFLAVHAAPWWPEGLRNVIEFGVQLNKPHESWRTLFPYLSQDESLIWRAMAELETTCKPLLFHGHTHRQAIWCWKPATPMQQLSVRAFHLRPDWRCVVGVGSVGLPEDGGWAAYAFYDADSGLVELVRLDSDHSSSAG